MSLATPDAVRNLQRALAGRSKSRPDGRLYSLYDKAYRIDVLWEAWRKVKANRGSAGVDEEDLEAIEASGVERFLQGIAEELRTKSYRPMPLRRVYIKKASGKLRPLGIPTVKDRVVQQAVRLIVEPIFEVHFSPMSFGFRPGRGCHQAVGEVAKYLNWGLVHVVEADITDCFGSIPHERLMKAVARRVADKAILRVIRLWLKCGVMEDGRFRTTTSGTPQGGVISPLLANIYLDELDRTWTERQMTRPSGANAHLVRYADDLVILTDKSTSGPEKLLRETLVGMGLALNPNKTRVLDATTDSFDFLGFNIRKAHNPKSGKWFALVRPSHKAQMAFNEKIRRLTSPGVQEKVSEVVRRINPVVRGWVNYFRIGHSAGVFNEVREFVLCRVRRYLCRKGKRHGYGWKRLPNSFFYGELGLIYEYKVDWQRKPAWGLG